MKAGSGKLMQERDQFDPSEFDALYHQYKSMVFGFAYNLTQNQGEAEDLFQETWLRVVQNLPKLNLQDFKAWVFTVTANLHRDALRKKRVRRMFFFQKAAGSSNKPEMSFYAPGNETAYARDESGHRDTGRAISLAVARLPGRQRSVFVLREMEGFKYSEISEMLKIPLGTVKTLMHRAVKRLRRDLSGHSLKRYPYEECLR